MILTEEELWVLLRMFAIFGIMGLIGVILRPEEW